MGDRVSTTFRFSGKLPAEHADALRILLDEENPENERPYKLSSIFDFEGVNYAQHDELWDFARTHNLDWTMTWEAGGGFAPGAIISRSGFELECGFVGDAPAISLFDIERLRFGELDAVKTFLAMFQDVHNQLPPLEIINA